MIVTGLLLKYQINCVQVPFSLHLFKNKSFLKYVSAHRSSMYRDIISNNVNIISSYFTALPHEYPLSYCMPSLTVVLLPPFLRLNLPWGELHAPKANVVASPRAFTLTQVLLITNKNQLT